LVRLLRSGYVSAAPLATDEDGRSTLFGDDVASEELAASDAQLAAALCPADSGLPEALLAAAARACARSHAPYSGCRAGLALELTTGEVVWGAAIENVGFNPSLPPLQVRAGPHACKTLCGIPIARGRPPSPALRVSKNFKLRCGHAERPRP
jgi:hypothetical protein